MESIWGRSALRRSKFLGKNFYLRNLGILVLIGLLTQAIVALMGFLIGVGFSLIGHGLIGLSQKTVQAVAMPIGGLVGQTATPVNYIAIILIYYDMRARKEAYDSSALADDLRR